MLKNPVQPESDFFPGKGPLLIPGYLTIIAATLFAYLLCIADYVAAIGMLDPNRGAVSAIGVDAHDAGSVGQDTLAASMSPAQVSDTVRARVRG